MVATFCLSCSAPCFEARSSAPSTTAAQASTARVIHRNVLVLTTTILLLISSADFSYDWPAARASRARVSGAPLPPRRSGTLPAAGHRALDRWPRTPFSRRQPTGHPDPAATSSVL